MSDTEQTVETLDVLLRACIVQIRTPTQQGTGFFVAPGRILTCAHVIAGAETGKTPITVLWQQHAYIASLLQRAAPTPKDPAGPDLALLQIDLTAHPCVLLAADVWYTDPLYTYGYSYPATKQDIQGDSVTLTYEGPTDDGRLHKLKVGEVKPGVSGAPLFNWRTGGVCGVVKSTRDDRTDLGGRAVPLTAVLQAFPDLAALQQEFHARDPRWRAAQLASPTTSVALTIFQVPYGESTCLGRDEALAELYTLLAPPGAVVAVTGLGGIGKTFLAATFAHRARPRFPGGIFWLRMAPPADVAVQVAACGALAGLNLHGWDAADFDSRVQLVRAVWQQDVPRLLVFDNLEDPALLRAWRPTTGGCRVLLTTRREQWPPWSGVQTVPLVELDRQSSRELLCLPRSAATGVPLEEVLADAAAEAICTEVGDLPLALAVAGAYLVTYPSLSLENYRAKLAASVLTHRSLTEIVDGELPTQHTANVAATFALSYEPLIMGTQPEDTLALTLLHRAAHLAPAPIPRRLLLSAGGRDPASVEEDGLEVDALRRLGGLGLLRAETDGTLRLHRLVATFVRSQARTGEDDRTAAEDALIDEANMILAAGYPQAGTPYLPHLRHAIDAADHRDDARLATLLDNLATLLQAQGDYATARPLYDQALDIRERVLGTDHIDTAESLNNLASSLLAQGDYAAARPLLERSVAICEQVLGPDHPVTAIGINNLAFLMKEQGDYTAARPLLERALAIRERVLGPDHPDTATALNNLARLLQDQGDYAAAQPLYVRAMAVCEQALGQDHPKTATALNSLARLLQDQGDYAAARPLFERARDICNHVLGPNHPDTALALSNLATLLQDQGDYIGARPLYDQALDIRERVLGANNPDTAESLNNLASLLRAQGNYAAARPFLERALAICEQTLGADHRTTATALNNLARLLQDQGDYAAARPLFERAVAITAHVFGPDHPNTVNILNNLTHLLQKLAETHFISEKSAALYDGDRDRHDAEGQDHQQEQ